MRAVLPRARKEAARAAPFTPAAQLNLGKAYLDAERCDEAPNAFARAILSTGQRPVLVTGEAVTDNYFDVLGIHPPIGRAFRADENAVVGAVPVVVLSHGFWQRRFGARPDVVGETIKLSGLDYTIVGVAPPRFTGTVPGISTEFWVPVMMIDRLEFAGIQTSADKDPGATRLQRRGSRWLFLKGRLADGRTVEQARSQVSAIFARLSAEYPDTNDKVTASVVTRRTGTGETERRSRWIGSSGASGRASRCTGMSTVCCRLVTAM